MGVDVGLASALLEGHPTVVRAGNRELVVTKWRDQVFAVRNVCPHQSQSFELGLVSGRLISEGLGEFDAPEGVPTLTCPWHGWQFEVGTGLCTTDERYRVRSYPTRIVNGRILVDVGPVSKRPVV